MEHISTTNLRTKSSQLIESLKRGEIISLIHRSKIVGRILPAQAPGDPIRDVRGLASFLKSIKPRRVIPRSQREKMYRRFLVKRHGKNLS